MTSASQQHSAMLRIRPAGSSFGWHMAAAQGEVQRKACLAMLVEFLYRSGCDTVNVLEVGAWAGASTATWARTIKHFGLAGRVLCVDFWQPYFDLAANPGQVYQTMTEAARDGSILELFLNNLRAVGVAEIVDYVVGDSKDVLPQLERGAFQLVFVDASHVYQDVHTDLCNAMPLVADGGILCGDDLEVMRDAVDPEAHRAALHEGVDYTRDPRTGIEYHPGVTEAVGELFGSVSCCHGVWAMRRIGDRWETIDLAGLTLRTPDHLALSGTHDQPVLLESHRGYNLVAWRGRGFAVRQSLGVVDVAQGVAALHRQYAPDDVFVAYDIEALRTRIDVIVGERLLADTGRALADTERRVAGLESTLQALRDALEAAQADIRSRFDAIAVHIAAIEQRMRHARWDYGEPLLVEAYRDFNIAAYRGEVFGLRQSLGEISVRDGGAALVARHGEENVVVAQSPDGVRARIDLLALSAELDRVAQTVRAILTGRAGRLLGLGR